MQLETQEITLKIDPYRWRNKERYQMCETRICARALNPEGDVRTIDIVFLEKKSLLQWLQESQESGGSNVLAENLVGILLGHGKLHE